MRRSETDAAVDAARALAAEYRFALPPFAAWGRDEWLRRVPGIRDTMARGLGWDVTDFGRGDFARFGLTLLTIRNGTLEEQAAGLGQTYAEKLMRVEVGQETPFHLHRRKTEDIGNRGGGDIVAELVDPVEPTRPVTTIVDGLPRTIAPGEQVRVRPGGSVQVPRGIRHRFWAEGEPVLAFEVSSVNDDANDNEFLEPGPRYPGIEEDVPAQTLLVAEYAALLG